MHDQPSIAVVVLDTLRSDAFEAEFDWLPGTRFSNARAPSHWTVPVHASLFAGRYPSELGVHAGNQRLDCPEPTLAEALGGSGYATRAFSSNVNVSEPFGFDRGFEEFAGSWRLRGLSGDVFDWQSFVADTRDEGPTRYARAVWRCLAGDCDTWASLERGARLKLRSMGVGDHEDDGAREALEFVRSTRFGGREFLFVNLMEAHGPYAPPPEYATAGSREELLDRTSYNALVATATGGPPAADRSFLRAAYDDAVRYLSDVSRELYDELVAAFDVVVTLSDHGELFGEHGAYQHGYGVYPELVHVPLVVSGADVPDGRDDALVSLLDVHATVLELAGLDAPSGGEPLVRRTGDGPAVDPTDRAVAAEYHGVNRLNRSALVEAGVDPEPYERELTGVVAPGLPYSYETLDGLCAPDGRAADAREAIDEHAARVDRRSVEAGDGVSEAVRRQLEDLGYA